MAMGLPLCQAVRELDSASFAHYMWTQSEHVSKCHTAIDSAMIILVLS